jgi:outer membrane biosynthesis protein TonB
LSQLLSVSINSRIERGFIMRKPLLAVTLFMISAVAQADPYLRVAQNAQPAPPQVVITTEPAEPTEAVESKAVETVEPAKAPEPARAAEQKPAVPAVAETKPVQTQKTKPRIARQESAEQKARRIAAHYGIYW